MRFITATGTDIGKTFVTALMLRQARAAGIAATALKPVLSGFDAAKAVQSDAGVLLAAMGEPVDARTLDRIAPWRFAAPLSPDMAAARERRDIPFQALIDHCRDAARAAPGPLLIEGVGGAMVPLDASHSVLDWMRALGCPALLVCGSYLGAISHCLTTAAAIRAGGVPITAIILSESECSPVPPAETAAVIARFTGLDVRIVPRGGGAPDLTDLIA